MSFCTFSFHIQTRFKGATSKKAHTFHPLGVRHAARHTWTERKEPSSSAGSAMAAAESVLDTSPIVYSCKIEVHVDPLPNRQRRGIREGNEGGGIVKTYNNPKPLTHTYQSRANNTNAAQAHTHTHTYTPTQMRAPQLGRNRPAANRRDVAAPRGRRSDRRGTG